jgi:DNA-binding transcriptional LysR family regulator
LEKELGVSLFARKGRNVEITQNGKRFLPYVEDALTSLENGRMTLQKSGLENKENIRIAFIYTMGEYVVPQLIHKYSTLPARHNVTFSFTQGRL